MGNEASTQSTSKKKEPTKFGFSWQKRKKDPPVLDKSSMNKDDFWIKQKKGECIQKAPGELCGEQLIIENCEDCDFYFLDFMACVTIDDCKNCRFFFGPIAGSIFIRTTTDSNFVVACQQFRTRDCNNLQVSLFAQTQPIIEQSTNIKLGCFDYFYIGLKEHFEYAELSVYNNRWSEIYDFTPSSSPHFSYLNPSIRSYDLLKPIYATTTLMTQEEEEANKQMRCIPVTYGERKPPLMDEDGLIIFFPGYSDDADQFLIVLQTQYPQLYIKNAREWTFGKDDANIMFNNMSLSNKTLQKYRTRTVKGPIISIVTNGPNAQSICKRAAELATQNFESYFLPSSEEEKNHVLHYIFSVHKKSM